MPRGKRTVFMMTCKVSGNRIGTVSLQRQNSRGISWKDFKREKYCPECRKKVEVKLKEEKHSS